MYTSVLLLALSGVAAPADAAEGPSWEKDYGIALKQAEQEKKPVAVFLCPGKAGYDKLCRDGGLGDEAKKALAADYVCVHIDTSSADGKDMAKDFGLSNAKGLVLSDRGGQKQALRYEGDMTSSELGGYLRRFASPDLVVSTTETNPGSRTSYYGPNGAAGAPVQGGRISYYQGVPGAGPTPYPVYGGGYCPTCSSCPGGRCR